jgi:putative oxidoreductase
VAVAGTGAGRLSLDYALFGTSAAYDYLHGWWGLLIAVVLGLAGGIGQLVIFYRPPAPKAA